MDINRRNELVSFRLLDFVANNTAPWQRRLWSVGSTLGIRETLEASEAVHDSVLSGASLDRLRKSIIKQVCNDPGVVSSDLMKRMLNKLLRTELTYNGADYLALHHLLPELENTYLSNWASILRNADPNPPVEHTARLIASHVLDAGFSERAISDWWAPRLADQAGRQNLPDILMEAQSLLLSKPREYEVLIAFNNSPGSKRGSMPPELQTGQQAAAWLKTHGYSTSGLRIAAGMVLRMEARDVYRAVEDAIESVDRIRARVPIGTKDDLDVVDRLWVAGQPEPIPMVRKRRGVMIKALDKARQLYVLPGPNPVDNAIELVRMLDTGPTAPAIASAWAAVESLLVGPGDEKRAIAAERLADIVACAFPRAELTSLSYACENGPEDELTKELAAAKDNHHRAKLLADAIKKGHPFSCLRCTDQLAYDRMKDLVADPRHTLLNVREHVLDAISRLYRQRNLVLHWGRVDAVCLDACLRTVAPLVGAGFDRIVHAWFLDHVSPLQLAAQARLSLGLVGSQSGSHLVELLS